MPFLESNLYAAKNRARKRVNNIVNTKLSIRITKRANLRIKPGILGYGKQVIPAYICPYVVKPFRLKSVAQ